MKIELYLDDNLVEINKDIDFVLNKQYTNLTDLTSIIVDYSKTIKVPMTPHNNELFNYVYKFEHQTVIGIDTISYNPSQKIPMTMLFNGSIVMEGYALLNSVNMKDKVYEINLYGQLGKIFSELKEKTIDEYKEHFNDHIFFTSVKMNTKTISDSIVNQYWTTDWDSQDWTNFFGFAPQLIGDADNFEIDTYETTVPLSDEDYVKFEDTINSTRGITYANVYVKDGFDFNQYCEMRTYMCRPYVYVNKLIQLVQNEINNGDYDGYTMTLDPDWFQAGNPYYTDQVYFPGTESIIDGGESNNGMVYYDNSAIYFDKNGLTYPYIYLPPVSSSDIAGYTYSVNPSTNVITIADSVDPTNTTGVFTLKADGIVVTDRCTGVGDMSGFVENGRWAYYNTASPQVINIRYIGIYDSDGNLMNKLYLCDDEIVSVYDNIFSGRVTFSSVWNKLKAIDPRNIVPESCALANQAVSNSYCELVQVYNFGNVVLNSNSFQFRLGIDNIDLWSGRLLAEGMDFQYYNHLYPFKNKKYKSKRWNINSTFTGGINPIQTLEVSSNNFRSGSLWNITDILGKDFVPFTWLIDFVKKNRLFFDIDYQTKTITLKGNYFDTVTYKKVIVDYSKEVIVEPLVDKYVKVNYGYREDESKKGAIYYKKNGIQYGDMNINTGININEETLSLNPNEDEGVFIPISMNAITWSNLMNSSQPLVYQNVLYTNKVITTLDADGKIQYFPFYAFREGNVPMSDTFWYLSDDTPHQKNTGSYTYLDHTPGKWDTQEESTGVYYLLGMSEIPQFDNYDDQEIIEGGVLKRYLHWVTFGVPKEVYDGFLPNNVESRGFYSRWQNWLKELFNQHNKKVTCYVRMSYPEYINFKFNQLFVIDNCVFLVNKIIDFNPNSTAPTKVELIQISDVNNLKTP